MYMFFLCIYKGATKYLNPGLFKWKKNYYITVGYSVVYHTILNENLKCRIDIDIKESLDNKSIYHKYHGTNE